MIIFGSEILAKSDFFGSMKRLQDFLWVTKKKPRDFLGCEKGLRDFFGYAKKSVNFFWVEEF